MQHPLSILGIIHTAISIVALVFAGIALVRTGKIEPCSATGKYYSIFTALGCITAFGLSKAGGFNPGHALAILILVLLAVAYFVGSRPAAAGWGAYLIVFCMYTTLLLSLLPAVNETFTRVPLSHPLATDINSPAIQNTLKGLLLLYVISLVLQFRQIWKGRQVAAGK